MKLSIVIPTLGRPSITRALESCYGADEIVVVLDTSGGADRREVLDLFPKRLGIGGLVYRKGDFGVRGGHAARQYGIRHSTGTHLAFMDDDDIYAPGAIKLMRARACDVPVIFRIDHYQHGILWRTPDIYFGNVSTQMYVVPNDQTLLGEWTPIQPDWPQPGGDCTFITETVERMGGPLWRDEIIAVLRPELSRSSLPGTATQSSRPATPTLSYPN